MVFNKVPMSLVDMGLKSRRYNKTTWWIYDENIVFKYTIVQADECPISLAVLIDDPSSIFATMKGYMLVEIGHIFGPVRSIPLKCVTSIGCQDR